jgi:hypothetical protein
VGCKVSGNLSERVFLLDLDLAMIKNLYYKYIGNDANMINYDMVVVKVVYSQITYSIEISLSVYDINI